MSKSDNSARTDNKKYRALFENSISALFITRPDGAILEVNQAACRMFGYSEKEFEKIRQQAIIDPETPGLQGKLNQREETGSTSGELIAIRKNGERCWCEFSSTAFEGPDSEKMFSITLIDISDKKYAQERLKSVINNVPGVIFRYALDLDGSGKIQFVSNGVKSVLGLSSDEIFDDLNLGWKNVHEDDIEDIILSINESAKKKTQWISEFRYHHPDGNMRWLRGMGNLVSSKNGRTIWDSMIIDISDEKQAQYNLKLMKSAVTEANDAVLITKAESVEAPDGPEIIYVNRGFEKMTGYNAEEVIGKTPRLLQGPNTGSKQLQKLREAIQKKESVEVELLNYSKKGEEYWINISLSPIFEGDKCTHFISIQRDITDRKLRELQQSLSTEISQIFNKEGSVKAALKTSLEKMIELKDFDAVEFWLKDRDKTVMNLAAYTIGNPDIAEFYLKEKAVSSFKIGQGLPGKTWKKKENLFWRNLDRRKTFIRRDGAASVGLKTAFSFPVKENDEVLGVLVLLVSVDLKRERYYVELFKELSYQLASEINRKTAEEELSRIFGSAPDVICIAGLDGYYKKVNPAMSDMLGYSEKELLNMPIMEFVHPDDRLKTKDEFEALNKGEGNHYFENRHITKSGQVIWLSWTTKPFYDEGVTYSVAKDITEEKELRELLDQANRLARIGSWEVDLVEDKIYWSKVTREILDVNQDEEPSMDKGLEIYKEGESRKKMTQAIEQAIEQGTPWDIEVQILTASGGEKWVRSIGAAEILDGKCVRLYGSLQDINKRKIAELKLEERTRHIQTIASLNAALLDYTEWFEALGVHLEMIGEAVQSDRVYYFENWFDPETGEGYTSQKLEWCREGIELQMDNSDLEKIPFSEIPELVDPMVEDRPSMVTLSEVGEDNTPRHVMESQDIKSFLTIPINVQGKFHGFIGFDNCTEETKWSGEEIQTLKTISYNLAVAIERSQTEKERSELLEEKNRILESISDAFYAIDENWNITYFNSEAENLLGRKSVDLVGNSIWDEFPGAKETELYNIYKRVMKGKESQNFEYYYPPLDSWYDISAYPAENGISVYFKNIDERKRTEAQILQKTNQLNAIATFNSLLIKREVWKEALDESLELFGKVADADRVYFFESNGVTEIEDMRLNMKLEWVREGAKAEIDNPDHHNQEVTSIMEMFSNLSENKPFNTIVSDIKDPEIRKLMVSQEIKSLLLVPVFIYREFIGFLGFDDCRNERRWNEEDVTFLQTISINLATAIENDNAEEALQKAYEEKNAILESIGDGFFALDRDLNVTYWNVQAEKMTQTHRAEIIGKNILDVFDDVEGTIFNTKFLDVLEKQEMLQFEDYYEPFDSWYEVSIYPSSLGLSVFFKNVTDRKIADERLKELNRILEQQTKELASSNAELEQFAFVASHDLQEPLRMITSFLAQLERKYKDQLDEKGKKYIHFATDGAKRMRQIILDLLDYSRVGKTDAEKSEVNINEVLDIVTGLHKKLIQEKKATVTWEVMPVIPAARGPIQQLFQNLLHNALSYQEKGKRPVVKIWSEDAGDQWTFHVKDNGIGIDPEYKDKIFNIFQRLHGREEYSGTGVGLAICKKIVEDHGGEIGVDSREGEGSTFYFTIAKTLGKDSQ